MAQGDAIRWGTDLVTFFNTEYWGLDPKLAYPDFVAAVGADTRSYFDAMLDGAAAAGLQGVELAPSPGGWVEALAAYGSAAGVREALQSRGLVLASSYQPGYELIGRALYDDAQAAAADEYMRRHCEFVNELGCRTIVMGTVNRRSFKTGSFDDVDASSFDTVARHLNRLGAIAGGYGVRIAIHTDAYSVCSREADIDILMSLTEPTTIALCPDVGHITLDGGNAIATLAKHIARVPLMHWKDCASPLPGADLPEDTMTRHEIMLTHFRVLGSGVVDWHEWMRILRDNRWRGWAIAEIDMSPDPVGEIETGLRYYNDRLSSIYR